MTRRGPVSHSTAHSSQVLLTAGPTREYWDSVRYLSNASSGRMALALTQEALRRRISPTVILGPVEESVAKQFGLTEANVVHVTTAREMDREVSKRLAGITFFIGAAAVADYRPKQSLAGKLKRDDAPLSLELVANPDILKRVSLSSRRPPVVLGFALETRGLLTRGKEKLLRKKLDWIVANPASNIGSEKGSGFLIHRTGRVIALARTSKTELAKQIWENLLRFNNV